MPDLKWHPNRDLDIIDESLKYKVCCLGDHWRAYETAIGKLIAGTLQECLEECQRHARGDCPDCGGKGWKVAPDELQNMQNDCIIPCRKCNGTGTAKDVKRA